MNNPRQSDARLGRVAAPDLSPDPVADAYRRWGYLKAGLDPLQRIAPYEHPDIADARALGSRDDHQKWQAMYCGPIGFEFMHMVQRDRVEWMRDVIEAGPSPIDSRWVLQRLMEVELFERFLHLKYVGSKRFSIEGVAALIPLLDSVLDTSGAHGADHLYIAMSHRGRLNVMKEIVNLPIEDVFAGIEDVDARSVLGSGDVKYHIGATGRYTTRSGQDIEVHLTSNPSHLEAVDSVVMGRARARQERWGAEGINRILPVTLHGDAAFAGQGITSETLNMADLAGYTVAGTIHVIVNNLIGFTAEPAVLQSTRFSSDAAKRLSIPILHVNAEEPEAVWWAGRIAAEYRYRFRDDVLIDLIGFRRYGHSEVEDPTVTQPLLYDKIAKHPQAYEVYAQSLQLDAATVEEMKQKATAGLSESHEKGRRVPEASCFWKLPKFWGKYQGGDYDPAYEVPTHLEMEKLRAIAERLTARARRFCHSSQDCEAAPAARGNGGGNAARRLGHGGSTGAGIARQRRHCREAHRAGFTPRHLQSSSRRTDRHAQTARDYVPLAHIAEGQAPFVAIDSPLTEAAALGFEYGYSREFPDRSRVVGGAVRRFRQRRTDHHRPVRVRGRRQVEPAQRARHALAARQRGTGARALQCATGTLPPACRAGQHPGGAAVDGGNYFHLLRRQALRTWRKPLIVMTPKSILRAEPACSPVEELANGSFRTVLADDEAQNVRGIILCTGKIAHELRAERAARGAMDRAIVTLEQLYPFPGDALREALSRHPSDAKITWVQEEPANMGALSFVRHRIKETMGGRYVTSVKRFESASPATGSAKAHALEQKALIKLAFA
jgi:2-oxoglutarate dehydrogenase E1 component